MLNISIKDNGIIKSNNTITVIEYNLLVQSLKALVTMSGDKLGDTSGDQIMKASDMFIKYTLYRDGGIENSITFVKENSTLPVDCETYDDGAFIIAKVSVGNTGPVVCNIGELDAKPLYNAYGQQLSSGELMKNEQYLFLFSSELDGFIYYNIFSEGSGSTQEYAAVGGDSSFSFKAADPVDDNDAVNVDYLTNLLASKVFDNLVVKDSDTVGNYNALMLVDGVLTLVKKDNDDNIINSVTIKVNEDNTNVWNKNLLINKKEAMLDNGYLIEVKRNNRMNKILGNPTSALGIMYKEIIDDVECVCINLKNSDTGEDNRYILNGNVELSGGSNIFNIITAKYISNDNDFTFIIDMDDKVWSVGHNTYGQLGVGDTTDRSMFIDTGKIAKYVSNDNSHTTFIIDMYDKVWATGKNNYGQLGLSDTTNRNVFTDTGKTAKYVDNDKYYTFIIDMDDKVWATGYNNYGQLGLGDTTDRDVFTDTGKTAKYVGNGYRFAFIIDIDDKVWSTGINDDGQLGLGDTTKRNVFTDTGKVAKYMNMGFHSTFIIDMDDKLWVTGKNHYGELGLGDTNDRDIFTDTGKTAKYVIINSISSVFIIDMDDKVWVTGQNDYGQLGLGDTADRNVFTDTGKTAKYVSISQYYTFIIDMDDKVWATGDNNKGQLGLGDTTDRDAFTDTGKTAKYVSTSDDYYTYIIDMDDKVWSTGDNSEGQLGLGDTTDRDTFTDTGKILKD